MVISMTQAHNPARLPCSAAILAGGAATRMGGAVKGLLEVKGKPLVAHLVETLAPLFDEVLLVVKDEAPYAAFLAGQGPQVRIVRDAWQHRSSLTGIHAALSHCSHEHCFVTACDTPLLRPLLLQALLERLELEDDVVLPLKPDGYFEPLCALYSRRCLPYIDDQLSREQFKIIRFFDKVRVRPLPTERLLECDPALVSFKNANTPEDLAELRRSARDVLGGA